MTDATGIQPGDAALREAAREAALNFIHEWPQWWPVPRPPLREFEQRLTAALLLAAKNARQTALGDCERVAGERSQWMPHDNDFTRGYAHGRGDAAAAIRTLAAKEPT